MEKIEQFKSPEVYSQKLLEIIEGVKWEQMEEIEYNGTNFLLLLIDKTSESDSHSDASVFQSNTIDGWGIYILENLPISERKRKLFHEILEANLRDQGFDNPTAHKYTFEEEQKNFGERKD